MSQKHTFSIVQKTNSRTGKPFGEKYAGEFIVRRPSLGDKQRIELREAAALSSFGPVDAALIAPGTQLIIYLFAAINTIGESVPKWFDKESLYDEDDELAAIAAWDEVASWLATFRLSQDPEGSGKAGE